MKTPKLPEINLTPAKPREGQVLELPYDFVPLSENPGGLRGLEASAAQARERDIQNLLREEEERARDAGMTVDELRYYQDLLQKKF